MYRSPIEIMCGDVKMQMEGDILKIVQSYDINVNKEELIHALKYDRNLYQKGYDDGFSDGHDKAMNSIVHCKDCKHRRDDVDFVSGHYCVLRPSNGGGFCKDEDFCSYGEREETWEDGDEIDLE